MNPASNTLHLVAIGENNLPMGGIGSACLLRVDEHLVLLGVRHVTDNEKRWALHIEYIQSKGAALFLLPAPTYFRCLDISSQTATNLDFFVLPIELPELPRHQKWKSWDVLSLDEPKRIFDLSDLVAPVQSDSFEFAGLVKPLLVQAPHPHDVYENVLVEHANLSLESVSQKEIVLKLAEDHPGDEWLMGTSGAPVTNQKGQLVGLVMRGSQTTNRIFAFPLLNHYALIHATLQTEIAAKKP